ncbi:plasmid pRiA4b ORF-3 family protein [Paraburkholderia tropica]|uniref:plasmid pRiA4b ORF-3 family protein n=1 Tax=Paraburkholderia tropica TaxID=92647 RepID=UPI002AB6212B|nr:plasmid pRiA4b ORF-3 family protein [Paraburkholderia tropica]
MINLATSYVMRVELQRIEPAVWRRIRMGGGTRLAVLHHIIQAAFGWSDMELHEFEIDGVLYGSRTFAMGEPAGTIRDEREYCAAEVFRVGQQCVYRYDFDQDWAHDIRIESATETPEPLACAVVIDGARSCPPESIGGHGQYQALLRALAGDPDSAESRAYRKIAGDDFDPERFDRRGANAALQRLAWNHWGEPYDPA